MLLWRLVLEVGLIILFSRLVLEVRLDDSFLPSMGNFEFLVSPTLK